MSYSTAIGDSQPKAEVCVTAAIPISVTTAAALADRNHAVNNTLISGKKKGAMYLYEVSPGVMECVVATGSATTSPWTRLTPEATVADLTLSTATKTDTAAHIATQLNLIEAAINSILTGNKITPS